MFSMIPLVQRVGLILHLLDMLMLTDYVASAYTALACAILRPVVYFPRINPDRHNVSCFL